LQGSNKRAPDWPAHPLNRGFDYFYGYMRHADGHEHYPKEGLYRGKKQVWDNRANIEDQLDKCYTTDLWTARAKQWIMDFKKSHTSGQPFFVYLAYDSPHAVLELPTQAYPKGGGIKGGLQWTGKPGGMINTASGKIDSWIHEDYATATYDNDKNPGTPEVTWPDVYKRYATSVRRIDDAVGDLKKLLKDLKIDENTLIVFTSDNGPSVESYLSEEISPGFFNSFGPFDGIKRDLWEGGVRMPALANWPGRIPARSVVKTPSAIYDWLPTFANAAGIPPPANTDGVSLLPALTGTGKQRDGLVYIEYSQNGSTPSFDEFAPQHQGRKRGQMQLIRFGDTVGIRYNIKSHKDDFEIYNVVTDPQQTNNLALNPGMEAIQKKMKDKVLRVRKPDTSVSRPYDQELITPVEAGKKQKGVKWHLYQGDFPWLPDVAGLHASAKGVAQSPSHSLVKENFKGVLLIQGYLHVPESGEYTFYLTADKSAMLRIHDVLVIDEDFGYKSGTECSDKIRLKAGMHPFRLYYALPGEGKQLPELRWEGKGIPRQVISPEFFYRD
jgi:arylsulfatase A-like enzyme